MREILFRGKRTDNGKWVTSDTIYQCNGEIKLWDEPNRDGYVEVIPETVGQYAGLTGKNGKKIFEGDICKNRLDEIMIVEWCEAYHTLCYKVVIDEIIKKKKTGKRFYGGWYLLLDCEPDDVEVIGNIHDNPELLEDVE